MAKARIFMGTDTECFQILSVQQNPNDSSIYFSAPEFGTMTWLVPAIAGEQGHVLLAYQSVEPGKLSLHGSGVSHVRPYESTAANELSITGNLLRSADGQMLSTRHLLTLFPAEPKHRPSSPARARRTDYVMHAKVWHPYVIVFWAIAAPKPVSVSLKSSFQVDDLEEVPPNSGWGSFSLATHAIVWFAYRTKHMARWPKNAQACFNDGYLVPLFVGTGEGQFRLEQRQPTYAQNGDQIEIAL